MFNTKCIKNIKNPYFPFFLFHHAKRRCSCDFRASKTGDFVQEKPALNNQYLNDPCLQKYLKRILPKEVFREIEPDLVRFGESVASEILNHHDNVCLHEPRLLRYDAWGKRVDRLDMHPSWNVLRDTAAQEGLVEIAYAGKFSQWNRIYQAVKLYLFHPSSGLYSCPLAMTDGAAKILKDRSETRFTRAFEHLTSRDPEMFWTSGQWMTEKRGGSDVGNSTETQAVKNSDGSYKLYGYKWFTSATDADIALTLAKPTHQKHSNGVDMFYLETRNVDGELNGISIEKLKKKLGTRQMPTAELILDGTTAYKLSEGGRGIASISSMLTVTRIHNSIAATSTMRRLLNLSKDYACKRKAFGTTLNKQPLHVQTLARLEVVQRGSFFLLMEVCRLFGLQETNQASDKEELLLRLLTPLLKLYTGKQAVQVSSECLESFGGHGYLEDTGLPAYLRDAQVLSIWEGTTNVLSLDVMRAIQKTNGEALRAFMEKVKECLTLEERSKERTELEKQVSRLQHYLSVEHNEEHVVMAARDLSYSLARIYIATLLYKETLYSPDDVSTSHVFSTWIHSQDVVPVATNNSLCMYKQHIVNQSLLYG